jgi:hypothetical protein
MSDVKTPRHLKQMSGGYEKKLSRVHGQPGHDTALKERRNAGIGNGDSKNVGSWDAYRNWLTKVQAPEKRRTLPDPALFSWKGYRSWAEKIRRNWDEEEQS